MELEGQEGGAGEHSPLLGEALPEIGDSLLVKRQEESSISNSEGLATLRQGECLFMENKPDGLPTIREGMAAYRGEDSGEESSV